MWQTDWAQVPPDGGVVAPGDLQSALTRTEIDRACLLIWAEHCVECAVPDCYTVCPLFLPRADQKCARFAYGIYPNRAFQGLLDYGAEIQFRRWGKLESKLGFAAVTPDKLRRTANLDALALNVLSPVSSALRTVNPKQRLKGGYNLLREKALRTGTAPSPGEALFDDFVIEVFNPDSAPVDLIVECVQQELTTFRQSVHLVPGHNLHRIPFAKLKIDPSQVEGKIRVYPDHDAEPRLVFTWLDFVHYKVPVKAPAVLPPVPAKKVKCVAWDLDNTLWHGILVEDGPEQLQPRAEALELIRLLDERGIIQTIVSKNDHEPALAVIRNLGLEEMFISPAINWGQKSRNLEAIAEALNINIDTFAVIDDSDFERREIGAAWPQVRVFPETQISDLLGRAEFDVPVTAESRQRRLSYLAEDKRKAIAQSYGDNYDDFLRSCGMTAHLFRPDDPQSSARCLELIQRSNQLNLSTRRYEAEEFAALLADPNRLPVALSVTDAFGDYGTVGFATVELDQDPPLLRDLVISCRVAKKKVEHAWFQWIAEFLRAQGHSRMQAAYKPTERNGVLLETLLELGFTEVGPAGEKRLLELRFDAPIAGADLVEVSAGAFDRIAPAMSAESS